ncbi:uroporphyrinogen-III C-methyltransferase [Lentisphaerota bacterium WC36G]|nr:uroporphyrinogen-III C-methyltransferase [Lentisphaerae bacterium WC36]
MKDLEKVLLTGARDSKLSVAQSLNAIAKLEEILNKDSFQNNKIKFQLIEFSSPGDRDQNTDLRNSATDFFSKDLDDALVNGEIDCAIHSAKDLPNIIENVNDKVDLMWLPWSEDVRDAIILPIGKTMKDLPSNPRIGISSERREKYCAKRFPNGIQMNIRGNINRRLEQLDNGDYDLLIMAVAALNRLGLDERLNEIISEKDLPPPFGQGTLAITFRKGDQFFMDLRKAFAKSVVFAGAGIGTHLNTTNGVINELKNCDVCLYDALCPQELIDYVPKKAQKIFVGKRVGQHSHSQDEINQLILDFARKGCKVVRLKGGDPGIFGRLAEEVEMLNNYQLPYKVLSGISSLNLATTCTGLLTTRRDLNRGFTVATPRKSGSGKLEWFNENDRQKFTQILFMGATEVVNIAKKLINDDNYGPMTPISIVFSAGLPEQKIVCGTLENIAEKVEQFPKKQPGLILIGEAANEKFLYQNNGALADKRVLFTGSKAISLKAINAVTESGGVCVNLPMIDLQTVPLAENDFNEICSADIVIVPSPSIAELLINEFIDNEISITKLPKIAVCGTGTGEIFKKYGIIVDIVADYNYGADGLAFKLEQIFGDNDKLKSETKIVRLKSNIAPAKLVNNLTENGFKNINEITVVKNKAQCYSSDDLNCCGDINAVMFCSPSAVTSFVKNFSEKSLINKDIIVIGEPTKNKVIELANIKDNNSEINLIVAHEATVNAMVESYIYDCVAKKIFGA